MRRGISKYRKNLSKADYKVDYVISHSVPQFVGSPIYRYHEELPNQLTLYFDELTERLEYKKWFFGRYHNDSEINDKFELLYNKIERII